MQGPDHAALSGCSSGFYPGISDRAEVPVLPSGSHIRAAFVGTAVYWVTKHDSG